MSDFGGLIKFRLPTGQNLSVRGSLTYNPHNLSAEAVANHDGSIDRTFSPQGYRFGVALKGKDTEGNPIDWAAIFKLDKVDFTFLHDTEKVDRTYTRASVIGDPQVDGLTGEASGVSGVSEGYLETRR
ncbi:hypothetical protein FG93_05488 [Bosea sp. LC85]|uniref:hypothetical protein n=1 Tax=Bosea sp. LC85 TaxID=1502851 RepID=UPI0004E40E89|nr:hypothetical protein [Bosea sp. LC85]KFC63978.1 hypothetical protein FG93_05488 [Bosea sp. LC85]